MISSTKRAAVKISYLILLIVGVADARALRQDYRPIPMSEFRVISGPKGVLVVSKTWGHVSLSNGDTTISSSKNSIELHKYSASYQYSVYTKNSKVGVIVTERTKLQNESACTVNLKDPIASLLKNDITAKIEEYAYSESLFDQSCGAISSELSGFLTAEFNPKESFLIKCLNSREINNALSKDTRLATVANSALAGYVAKISDIEHGKSKLQIKCEAIPKSEYDPKSETISFAMKNGALAVDNCKSTSQVIAHELLHSVGLNEKDTAYFDSICGNVLKVDAAKKSSCKEVYSKNLDTGCGVTCAKAAITTQKTATKKRQQEITQQLKQEIKTAEFVPVQDADIQEITDPTTPERYNKSVDRVYTAMSANLEKMAQPLNRAIAASVSTAEASTTLAESSSGKVQSTYKKSSLMEVSSARTPASSSRANANEEYTVEEILADKYNVPVESVRSAAAASSELLTAATATTTPKAANDQQAKQQAQPRGGSSRELAGAGSAGAGASLSSATQGGVPGRSTSSSPNLRNPASTGGGAPVHDNTIKQLGTFNEIRGEKYKRIQERYSDPTFGDELAQQGLAIEYKSKNMTIKIGNDRNALFRDDGKVLKKVTGAK